MTRSIAFHGIKKLIKNIFVPLLEIQPKTIEYNENLAKEERIVKIVSKIEHSIFDKNFTYFANPNKECLDKTQENPEKTPNSHNSEGDPEHHKKDGHNNNHAHSHENEENEKAKAASDQDSLEECLVRY